MEYVYIYLRRCYKKYEVLPEHKTEKLDEESTDESTAEKLLWLRNNRDPFATCLDYWKETIPQRLREIPDTIICEYYKEYPILKHPLGYLLVSKLILSNYVQ